MSRERNEKKDEIEFFYRGTNLPENFIIISVKLRGKIEAKEAIEKKQNELIRKKKFLNQVKLKHVEVLLKTKKRKKSLAC